MRSRRRQEESPILPTFRLREAEVRVGGITSIYPPNQIRPTFRRRDENEGR